MFRQITVANRLCFDSDIKRNAKFHQRTIQSMKPSLTHQAFTPPKFIRLNLKAKQNQRQRSQQIGQRNIQLIERISSVKTLSTSHKIYRIQKPYREKEYNLRVENERMAVRLLNKKSAYQTKRFLKSHQISRKFKSNISMFPTGEYKPNKTFVNVVSLTVLVHSGQLQNQHQGRLQRLPLVRRRVLQRDLSAEQSVVDSEAEADVEGEQVLRAADGAERENILSSKFGNKIQALVNAIKIEGQTCFLKVKNV